MNVYHKINMLTLDSASYKDFWEPLENSNKQSRRDTILFVNGATILLSLVSSDSFFKNESDDTNEAICHDKCHTRASKVNLVAREYDN